jgi:membrane protease YdiL (CAAX protease family)
MSFVKRYPLIVFFVLAFLLSWLVWGTSVLQARGLLSFHIPQSLAFWISLPVAAFGTAALSGGRQAILDLLKRIVRWQANPLWYTVALLLTAAIGLASIGVLKLLSGSHTVGVDLPFGQVPGALAFQIFFFTLTEETAWRGFALPRLLKKYNALVASLILGLLWGLWHIPLFLIPGSFQASLSFPGFVLSALATSILFTWVFNHTGGSVLIAGLFHAATDVSIAALGVLTGDIRLFWLFIGLQWLVAVAVILIAGPERLSRTANMERVHAGL